MKTHCNIIEINDLCVRVDNKSILDHLDLTIPYGEVHALLGQNGSGKTSLMMTIMGFSAYKITQGEILFEGQNITDLNICQRAHLGIAMGLQRPPTVDGVAMRSILTHILRNRHGSDEKLKKLASLTQTELFLDRNINDSLSGGEIKRSELLQLLALSPKFCMMDEPDSGVDIEALSLIGKLINHVFSPDNIKPAKRNAGLIITHSGNILDYLNIDKAHIMHNGNIGCSGNPTIMLDKINSCGYEECIRCMARR